MATWNGQIAVAEWYALGGVVAPGPTVPTAPQYNLLPPPQQQHHQPQQPSAEQPQQQQPMLQQLPQPQQLQQGNVHGLATPMPMRPVRQLPAQYGGAVPSFDASPISAHHATLISTHLIPRVAVAAAPPIGSSTAGGSVASPHTVIASSPSQPVPASISARDASGHTVAQLTLEGNTGFVTVWPAGDKTKVGVRRKRDDESGVELVSIKVKRGDSSVKVEWLSLGNRTALGDFDTSSTITKAERVDGLDKNGSVTVSFPLTPRVEMPAAQQATQLQSVNVNPEIVDDEARFKIDVVGAGTAIEFVKEQQGVLVLLVTRAAPLYVMLEASEYPAGQQHYLIHLGDRVIKRGHEDAFELGRTDNDDGGTELVVTLMVEAQATVAPEEGGDSQSSDGWC